jgi:adenylate kinase family enzyme
MTYAHVGDCYYAYNHHILFILLNRVESEYIKNVVEHVTRAINKRDFSRDFYTASVKSAAQDVIQQLKQSKSPFLLGIWGMPGIGKSTIAQAIYDQIGPYFEHKCLLKNMEENDIVSLQRKLLFHIHKLTEIEIPTIGSVSEILKEKLQHKRLLLVLDDVDKEQLKALCEIWDWFGPGSKIIIATTDRHLLKEHGVDHIYPVNELNESESLELFNWCVFSEATTPPEDFVELTRQMVAYSAGLPLALTALGRFLCQKTYFSGKAC